MRAAMALFAVTFHGPPPGKPPNSTQWIVAALAGRREGHAIARNRLPCPARAAICAGVQVTDADGGLHRFHDDRLRTIALPSALAMR